jgi:hypothetical protein
MKKILFFVLAAGIFPGCDKNDDTTASLDVTMANVAGNYKITAATMSSGGGSVDIFNNATFFDVCDRDDVYGFTASGNYTVTDAGVQCSPANTDAGTYTVNTGAKTITIDGEIWTVTSLTSSRMVATQSNFMGSAGATGTVTFTRQ